MKTFLSLTVLILALAVPVRAADILWNFGSTSAGTLSPTSGTPIANLTVSDISRANGGPNDTQANIIDSGSNSGGAYAGASGDNNAQAIAPSGSLDITTSAWFEFTLTPSGGNQVTVTAIDFGSRSSSGGPLLISIRSSLDGYASNVASANVLNDLTWAYLTPIMSPVSSGTDTPITFRIYASDGSNGNAVNWRIDDFKVTTSVGVVPEPSILQMLGMGAGLLVGAQRLIRRKR